MIEALVILLVVIFLVNITVINSFNVVAHEIVPVLRLRGVEFRVIFFLLLLLLKHDFGNTLIIKISSSFWIKNGVVFNERLSPCLCTIFQKIIDFKAINAMFSSIFVVILKLLILEACKIGHICNRIIKTWPFWYIILSVLAGNRSFGVLFVVCSHKSFSFLTRITFT